MIKYIIKRLLYTIPTLLLTSILVFSFVRMIPGDAAEAMLGDMATEEELEAYREIMGLKEPIIKQYIIFITNAVRGDLGTSVAYSAPVLDLIVERMETTLFLGFMAAIVILIFALPIGIISAVKVNSAIDQTITVVAMFLASVPAFWLG